jgi:asparagine synthase (glutamine-hydrolysing)
MCGIAGVLDRSGEPVLRATVRRMGDAIVHRGPDGAGQHCDGPVGLASRRLAVIDPRPEGDQPMTETSGDYVIVYNGEVYNFAELRRDLVGCGRRFRTRTDTEVVLNAYAEWGPAAVERFNGMFAFAIWDRVRRELFLARDRYGIKPLYFATRGDLVLFGSEVKALLAHGAVRADLSPEHLLEYLTFQNIFSDGTLFKGVRLLPAGHHMTLSADRPIGPPVRYWDFNFEEPEQAAPVEEYREELDRLFRQAVSRQLVADKPIGAQLSGGMDSGSITALASRELPHLSTFTVGFDMTSIGGLEVGVDERAKAEAMSYMFQTEQYEVVLKSGDMERCLPELVWHLEDPRVGQSYPNFYVSRLASRFVTACLSGTGGDELFAGYPWRYYRAVVNQDFDDYVSKYYDYWARLLPDDAVSKVFRPDVRNGFNGLSTRDVFRSVLPDARVPQSPEEYVNHSLHLEAKTFLHGLLLVEDKLSMAHGLESRVPFLDNDLVDFAQRVPVRLKLRDLDAVVKLNENDPAPKPERYFQRTSDGKLLLRQAMERYVPAHVTGQIKQGFSGPDASWFRGDSIDYVRRLLLHDDAAIYEFLDPKGIRPLIDDHLSGRENRRLLLWSLISLEHWCQIFLAGGVPPDSGGPHQGRSMTVSG